MSVSNEEESKRIFLAMVPHGWAKASTPEGAIAGAAKNMVCSNDYGWFKVWSFTGTSKALDDCYVSGWGSLHWSADARKELWSEGEVKAEDRWGYVSSEQQDKYDSITRITIKEKYAPEEE